MACSASMKAARPPAFCASAMMCRARAVLPLDWGPQTATTRPRGTPPTPRAMSRARAPVGMEATLWRSSSPMRMIEPFPNCRSIWEMAASIALLLSKVSSKKRVCQQIVQSACTAPDYTVGISGSQGILSAPAKCFSARGLQGVGPGNDLTRATECARVLAVDLHPHGPCIAALDVQSLLGHECLREPRLGHLLVGCGPVGADQNPRGQLCYADKHPQRIRWSTLLRYCGFLGVADCAFAPSGDFLRRPCLGSILPAGHVLLLLAGWGLP